MKIVSFEELQTVEGGWDRVWNHRIIEISCIGLGVLVGAAGGPPGAAVGAMAGEFLSHLIHDKLLCPESRS